MKEDILLIIENNTLNNRGTTISDISFILEKSRNLITRELNNILAEKSIFCIEEPELMYYDKSVYQLENNCVISKSKYKNLNTLNFDIEQDEFLDFEKLIGYKESLSNSVEQCKAAISYPNNSLPTLLYGATGTGKSFIAQLMYEYAVNKGIIESDKKFVTVNCSEYTDNPELLTANLFGHKKGAFTGADSDNVGLIQVADGGVLFLDEVHCLKPENQEKLFLFMDKGVYQRLGENDVWHKSNVRMIFATTEKPETALLKTFLRRVPITVTIPSLKERGISEKIQLIYSIFLEESRQIKKKIRISNFVYNVFLNHTFEGNVGDLKNIIRVCCANALVDQEDTYLAIHMKHLPSVVFKDKITKGYTGIDVDNRMLELEELNQDRSFSNKVIEIYSSIIKLKEHLPAEEFLKDSFSLMKDYYNHLVYDKSDVSDYKSDFVLNKISEIFKEELTRYHIKISNNDLLLIDKYVHDMLKNLGYVESWNGKFEGEIEQLVESISPIILRELMIANSIVKRISITLDMKFPSIFVVVLAINLHAMNQGSDYNRRLGVILAHGYSTASSIANAANTLLDEYIFEGIDMPIEMSNKEIIQELNAYLAKMTNYEDLVLLVDMGSLEEIYKGIEVDIHANIGIINNITTKLALEIGNKLRNDIKLETLLQEASSNNPFRYHIIEKNIKKDVILCACASGLGTAEKIRDLFVSSLDSSHEVDILTYDYNSLVDPEKRKVVFDEYNVHGIIGTLNPGIEGIPFVPLEEIIVEQDVPKVDQMFSHFLNAEEIDDFKKRLLKNFSLTNLMDTLTILNPTKLLEHVASALDDFQIIYGVKIKNSTSVGLYVHTCCMIERMVTQQQYDNYPNIDQFEKDNEPFIRAIDASFAKVERFYGVKIPLDEMGYIYDYIVNNG